MIADPMPRRHVRHRAVLATVLVAGAACSEVDLPPVIWEGEHVAYATDESLDGLCAGTLPKLDAVAGHLAALLGGDEHLTYSWVPGRAGDFCPSKTAVGCAGDEGAISEYPTHQHEVVHTVSGHRAHPALEEGIAEAFGDDWEAFSPLAGDYREMWESARNGGLDGSYYPLAGYFASYLIERFGLPAVLELKRASNWNDSLNIDDPFARRIPADVWVLGAERLLGDRQRPLTQRLGSSVVAGVEATGVAAGEVGRGSVDWVRSGVGCCAVLLGAIACGKGRGVVEDTSTGMATSTTTESGMSSSADATSSGASTSSETTSSATSGGGGETAVTGCSEWTSEDECTMAGCFVERGEAFAWDDATGVCTSLGPTFVFHPSDGVVTAPGFVWREVDGVIEVVKLNNSPFQLEGWEGCGCRPGDPLACFGCADGPGCVPSENCSESIDAEACAAHHPSEYCAWVEVTTLDGDGTACTELASEGRCIVAFPDEASCELVDMPRTCAGWTNASPPYVRSVGGAMELLRGTTCDALPTGYMPCWSSPVADPAACECGC